jgi:hypothetical protein
MGWITPASHTSRRSLRRIAALAATCALSLTGLVAAAPAANAEVTGTQFQVSSSTDDYMSSIAYDSTHNRYLVAWLDESGSNDVLTGQLRGAGGSAVGASFAIYTFSGGSWGSPGIAYNATDDQFLVTWVRSDNSVFAQRVASDGSLSGSAITVSSNTYSSMNYQSDVAWSPDAGQYLVVWHGYNSTLGSDAVRGRLVAPDGTLSGTSDLLISTVDTEQTTVAYNTVDHEFLVVWNQDNEPSDGWGIWGRRVATDGTTLGESSFRISHTSFADAYRPRIAFDPDNDRYLVVWIDPSTEGGGNCAAGAWGAYELFGQLVDADGTMVGSSFQISDRANSDVGMGVFGPRCAAGVTGPVVAYDPGTDRYLAAFSESATRMGSWQDSEIYGDYITSAGALVGTRDFQISDMGTWADPWSVGLRPSLAFNSTDGEFMTVWFGSTTQGSLTHNDYNIWGSRVSGSEPSAPPPTETAAPQTAIKLYSTSWYAESGSGPFYRPVYMTANAFDGLTGSGIAQIRCAVDPSSEPTTFADLPDAPCAPVKLDSDGQHTVYAASIDVSGNTSAVVSRTVQVAIDTLAPTMAPTVSPSSTLVLNQPGATASPNATDALSGVADAYCDEINTTVLGEHSATCYAWDNVSNYGTSSVAYLVGYKTIFSSPADGAAYTAGKAVSIDVALGDYDNNLISTADALAMAKASRVKVSVSGAVTLASTPMKYSRSTNQFGYRLRIPRSATTGTATITVTISYGGTTLTSTGTRTINITGLLSAPAPEAAPSGPATSAPPPELPSTSPSPTEPAEGDAGQQPATGSPSTESAQPSTGPEVAVKPPKGGHVR